MTTISKNNTDKAENNKELEAIIIRERARVRSRRILKAQELASRIRPQIDGTNLIERFDLSERVQHFVLIFSFTALGFTGLMQTFSTWFPIAWFINVILGGVDTLRVIHHLAAVTFIIQTVWHGLGIVNHWFVKKELGSMMPAWSDLTGLIGMLKYNLGLAKSRPEFDRFSIEEKVEYWALWWGAVVMGITGIMQWFPSLTTQILPGGLIPGARLIHMLEAILAVLAISIWHSYHTMIKERNYSIFTGVMSEHEMKEAHPLEYRRIFAARDFLVKLQKIPVQTTNLEYKEEMKEHELNEHTESNHANGVE
ncbi:MAG: hypothetical protein HZB50_16510 [Chloroflexi bacterium]|nr:hypothetical protein [Chloroflexota bacterium]